MFGNMELDRFSVGVPVIGLVVFGAMFAQYLLKRVLDKETLKRCHEVGGYYLSVVSTFYAVLIGLIVFDAISKFQTAEQAVESEGKSIISIQTLSKRFPAQEQQIRAELTAYIDQVVGIEWNSTKREERVKGGTLLLNLLNTILMIEPKSQNQQALYPTLTSEALSLWESRRSRVRETNYGLPVAEWVVLIVGALITIVFTYFFTIESGAIQLLMTGMMTLLVSMSLYLVLLFGYPFHGDLKVSDNSLLLAHQIVHGML
jgi:hypothetical protein